MASPQWMFQTDLPNDVISNSLRFNDGDSPELTKTWGANETDSNHFTVSFWVKRCLISSGTHTMLQCDTSGGQTTTINFQSDDTMYVGLAHSGTGQRVLQTTQKFRDIINWYHILLAYDSENGTNALKARLYVNGTEVTTFGTDQRSSIGGDEVHGIMDNGATNTIGFRDHSGTSKNFLDGYLAHFHCIDGQTLTPSDFTQIVDGVCVPKTYTGSYGNNGFRLEFKQTGTSADASGIGADTSGNTNHFTSANLAASDVVIDTPENNFCTMSPLVRNPGKGVFTEGNLQTTSSGSPAAQSFGATFAVSSGKWYWEGYINTTGTITPYMAAVSVGAGSTTDLHGNAGTLEGGTGSTSKYVSYGQTGVRNGSHGYNNVLTTNITAIAQGQVIGFALDMDNKELRIYNNGVAQFSGNNVADSGDLVGFVMPAVSNYTDDKITMNFGQDDTFAGALSSNNVTGGGGKFRYAPPAGYVALCSRNLSEPIFSANPNRPENANDNFIPYSYTADNTDNKARTGMGFQPDFLWIKCRDTAFSNGLYDSSRGANEYLSSNTTGANNGTYDLMSSFDSDGFTTQTDPSSGNIWNYSSDKYIVWSWKANGGTTTTNDASATGVGDIDSTYQVNTTGGFSIVTYSGSLSSSGVATVAHGLEAAPKVVISKDTGNSGAWIVQHPSTSAASTVLELNTTSAVIDKSGNGTLARPTSTVFSTNYTDGLNNSSKGPFIAYCFTEIEGYSKFGTYTGNGNADGAYVHLGFKPALFVAKSTGTENWIVLDNKRPGYNPTGNYLYWNLSNTEGGAGGEYIDLLSNGVKLRTTGASANGSATFVYMAWAESPFKYSNAA